MDIKELNDKLLDINTHECLKRGLEDMTEYSFSNYGIELCNQNNIKLPENHLFPNSIAIEYYSGGNTGGSCWGGKSRPYKLKLDELPDVRKELIIPITEVCQIHLDFSLDDGLIIMKKLENQTKTLIRSVYEYYGNSTDYTIHYILIEDIINAIKN